MMWRLLLHITGADDESGVWYGFWSGFAGCLPEFAALGLVWRKVNCHARGCPRIGVHQVRGSHFVTCRKHHPDHAGARALTAEQINESTGGSA